MPTECSADLLGFAPVEGREVVAGFDDGAITEYIDLQLLVCGASNSYRRGLVPGSLGRTAGFLGIATVALAAVVMLWLLIPETKPSNRKKHR